MPVETEIALICVGTPSQPTDDVDLGQLQRVVAEIASGLTARRHPLIVAVRSTVFPGTCESVLAPVMPTAAVVSNPEFMREGSAVRDFFEPSLVVVGGADVESVRRVAALYAPLGVEPCLVSLRTAELIKYASNAYHAVKISFANEIATLSEQLGVSGREVMEVLCRDVKLNISPAYLRPGFAFGGSCLAKDLRALNHQATKRGLELPLLASTLPSNLWHLERAIASALTLPGRIGVFGLGFKENTDDVRESPAIVLIESLLAQGREVRVHDPNIRLNGIYGANQRFLGRSVPQIERIFDSDLHQFLSHVDHVVLTQRPDGRTLRLIEAVGLRVLNLAGSALEWPGA